LNEENVDVKPTTIYQLGPRIAGSAKNIRFYYWEKVGPGEEN
jgi:hypothetical protein